jgi:hypothetical protein
MFEHPHFPNIPPVTGIADVFVRRGVIEALYRDNKLSRYLTFNAVRKLNKWGTPERLEAKEIIVSSDPINGFHPDTTVVRTLDGNLVHVLLIDQDRDRHAYGNVFSQKRDHFMKSILVSDTTDNVWCYELTGEKKMRRVDDTTSQMMAAAEAHRRSLPSFRITDHLPFMGHIDMSYGDIVVGFGEDVVSLIEMSTAERAEFDEAMKDIRPALAAAVDRQQRIQKVFDKHFTDENLAVFNVSDDYSIENVVPSISDFELRQIFDAKMTGFTYDFLNDLKADGLLDPCPNNGYRDVGCLTAWNKWLADDYEAELPDPHTRVMYARLDRSPAFAVVKAQFIFAAVEQSKLGGKFTHLVDRFRSITERDFFHETVKTGVMTFDLVGKMDDERYALMGSFLKPVLGMYDPKTYELNEVPVLPEPKYVRHVELPTPSGVLVMDQSFEIEGFYEGLKVILSDEYYSINFASGLDRRSQDYLEKLGLCIVQTGSFGTQVHNDTSGIWRVGMVDEYDPRCHLEEPAWVNDSDIWSNVFGDREAVINVLMASNKYGDRNDAAAALDAHISDDTRSTSAHVTVDRLHVYMPTGAGIAANKFHEIFDVEEYPREEWREDKYVISERPLTLKDPSILVDHDWAAAEVAPGADTSTGFGR